MFLARTRRKNIAAVFRQSRKNSSDLCGRFTLAEYDFRHAGAQSPVMINFGEAQILKRQMAEACDGIVGRKLARAYLLKKFADGFGVQGWEYSCEIYISILDAATPGEARITYLGSSVVASMLRVGSSNQWPRQGTKMRDHRGAHLARYARFVEVDEEQPSQSAWGHFAGKVSVVNLASDAVSPL